jgi:hypothetical protein
LSTLLLRGLKALHGLPGFLIGGIQIQGSP